MAWRQQRREGVGASSKSRESEKACKGMAWKEVRGRHKKRRRCEAKISYRGDSPGSRESGWFLPQ
jgi:hypothetical protein